MSNYFDPSVTLSFFRSSFFLVFCKDLPVKWEPTVINPFSLSASQTFHERQATGKRVESRTLERGREGVLFSVMAYTGRLHPKGAPFSYFRYMKGYGFY